MNLYVGLILWIQYAFSHILALMSNTGILQNVMQRCRCYPAARNNTTFDKCTPYLALVTTELLAFRNNDLLNPDWVI